MLYIVLNVLLLQQSAAALNGRYRCVVYAYLLIYLVNTIATWAVICAGLEKQELNKNLYGQNFCSQFCFLTAGVAEKAVVNDENIFSFLICQITNVIIDDIRGKKRSKMEPVCFCGIKEAIIRVLGKIFPKRAC